MPKPVCVKCQMFYHPSKNGTPFIEGMPSGPGWVPYKLWVGDEWECRGCGAKIIIGCLHPVAEHYESSFKGHVEFYAPQIQVNDC